MFKKKPDIPPRPKIPTVQQIMEDIEHSSPDDNVFRKKFIGKYLEISTFMMGVSGYAKILKMVLKRHRLILDIISCVMDLFAYKFYFILFLQEKLNRKPSMKAMPRLCIVELKILWTLMCH